MSRLEKFINNNREEFDDMVPPEKLWQQVEAAIVKKGGKRFFITPLLKWSTAAAAVLLIVAGAVFISTKKQTPVGTVVVENTDTTSGANEFAPEDAPEMNQFAKLIAGKQQELKTLAKEQPVLYQTFSKDITQLDSSYNTLKSKLSSTPNRELLIEAMIQNLELQLNVLNQQLNIIHQIKQSKKYGHEKNKSYT